MTGRPDAAGGRGGVVPEPVATHNVGAGSTQKKLHDLGLALAIGVALMGLQEASDRALLLKAFLRKNPTWRAWSPPMPGAPAVPILYDRQIWQLLRRRSVLAVVRRWVGRRGAGPTWAKPKRINIVVLRHRETRQRLMHLNTHLIPSVRRGGLPADERRARVEHITQHLRVIARIVRRAEKRGLAVVVTLDANLVPADDLLDALRAAGLTGWTREGTHGNRPIDHVLTAGVDAGPAVVIPIEGHDHDLVVRELHMQPRSDRSARTAA